MQIRLIGYQPISFTNREGEIISGTNIFCAFKDSNVEGLRTEKFFVKPDIKIPELKVNDLLELSFNMRGKIESVSKT